MVKIVALYSKVFAQYLSCDHIFRESPSKFKVCQMLQVKKSKRKKMIHTYEVNLKCILFFISISVLMY